MGPATQDPKFLSVNSANGAVLTGVVEIGALLLVHTLYLFLYLKIKSAVGCLTLCMVRFDVLSALFQIPLYLVVGCFF